MSGSARLAPPSHGRSALSGSTRSPRQQRAAPIFNKQAKRILEQHLHSVGSLNSDVSVRSDGPAVLQLLDSSASKTARSHDISYLRERPNFLTPRLPASRIPRSAYVYEKSFLPKHAASVYDEQEGLWVTAVFPSMQPSSRMDAVLLDEWISKALADCSAKFSTTDDLLESVQQLVPLLTVGLHEVVRQVSHTCAERGQVLDKIWKAYVALFSKVLHEMKQALDEQRAKTYALDEELDGVYQTLESLRCSHPITLQNLITQLEREFQDVQMDLEARLARREKENQSLSATLKQHHVDLETWYPRFTQYQASSLKTALPRAELLGSRLSLSEGAAPEVAIAEDFKRMLAALPPETRKEVGVLLASAFEEKEPTESMDAIQNELRALTKQVENLMKQAAALEDEQQRLIAD